MPRRYSGRRGSVSDAKMALQPMLDECLARWSLTPDGTPLTTHTSILLPVRQAGMPVMLKLVTEAAGR
jgi:streptomycin 6-kinase